MLVRNDQTLTVSVRSLVWGSGVYNLHMILWTTVRTNVSKYAVIALSMGIPIVINSSGRQGMLVDFAVN